LSVYGSRPLAPSLQSTVIVLLSQKDLWMAGDPLNRPGEPLFEPDNRFPIEVPSCHRYIRLSNCGIVSRPLDEHDGTFARRQRSNGLGETKHGDFVGVSDVHGPAESRAQQADNSFD
jgi:hypothetical protein